MDPAPEQPETTPGVLATGVGSLPGEDFAEAVRIVIGELPDFPHLPELPARGPEAGMTGRALAMITELGFDLQPAGWRLTDSAGVDHRRARSLLAQDLDVVEEQAAGLQGEFKLQVTGPWTLAATVERPRGDRLLADHGAGRELAQALAAGVTDHVTEVRRRLPGVRVAVQVDEPALPAVLAARVPTASGFGRHRTVDAPAAAAALGWVFDAISGADAEPLAHCCAADAPITLLRDAGARGVSADLDVLVAEQYEPLAEAFDAGVRVMLGVVPATDPEHEPTDRQVVERVRRLLDMIGFAPEEVAESLVLTPSCGLAGATPDYARTALSLVRESAARIV